MISDIRRTIILASACAFLCASSQNAWAPPNAEKSPASAGTRPPSDQSAVVAVVNGRPITENQVAFFVLARGRAGQPPAALREKIVGQLIENELVRQFLADRRAEADPKQLSSAIAELKERLRRRGVDPDASLKSLGYNDAALRRELALPLAWDRHLGRVVSPQMLREEFDRHREEYDGTEVRASQIFIKLDTKAPASAFQEAEDKLSRLRAEIVAKRSTFADAAHRFSDAPSRSSGGDVGFFQFSGKMPVEITRFVFPLKTGEISRPFRTPFGLHLYTVTARRPGQLSLEDARPEVLRRLSNELWQKVLSDARAKAHVERPGRSS